MSNKPLNISESAAVQMPMKTVASLILLVAAGVLEDLYKSVEKMEKTQEMNMTNKVNIEFLSEQLDKALKDIEELKDKVRENGNGKNY
jgi:hypothetical protein